VPAVAVVQALAERVLSRRAGHIAAAASTPAVPPAPVPAPAPSIVNRQS
jgi:hypothetical protein